MKYLNRTNEKNLTISDDNLKMIKCYVDESFAVHPDFKSNIREMKNIGQGAMQSVSSKHKLNTRISTDSELVAVGDTSVCISWKVLFIEWEG